jgi:hypothetical protein
MAGGVNLGEAHGRIDIDASGVRKGILEAQQSFEQLSKAGTMLSLAVTAPLMMLGKSAVAAASDTVESLNKVNVVFKDSAKTILEFGDTSAEQLGISTQEAYASASGFGTLFNTMRLGSRQTADMSMGIVRLAGDLGSMNNLDTSLVLEKLRAGLIGETEPLRSLSIFLDAATVKAKAMAMGLADASGEVSNAALMQARYALIMEQGAYAMGDFANTSNELANSTKITKAELRDAAAAMGESLIPMAKTAVGAVRDVAVAFNDLSPVLQNTIVEFGLLAAAIGPALKLMQVVVTVGPAVAGALASPLGALTALLGGLFLWDQVTMEQGAAMGRQQMEILKASKSYEDYAKAMLAAGLAARQLSQDAWNATKAMADPAALERAKSKLFEYTFVLEDARYKNEELYAATMDQVRALAAINPLFAQLAHEAGVLSDAEYAAARAANETGSGLRELGVAGAMAASGIRQTGDAARDATLAVSNLNSGTREHIGLNELRLGVPGAPEPTALPGSARYLDLERIRLASDALKKMGTDAGAAVEKSMSAAWQKATSQVDSFVGNAQSQLAKLRGDKGDPNAAGANGWAEAIFRAADVEKLGTNSPWAKQIGEMLKVPPDKVQAAAAQVVKDFQAGAMTAQVESVLNVPMLINQVRMAAMAEQMKTAFVEKVAAAAGVGTSFVDAVTGFGGKEGPTAAVTANMASLGGDVVTALAGQQAAFETAGGDLIKGLIKGMEGQSSALSAAATRLTEQMLAAIRAAVLAPPGPGAVVPPVPPAVAAAGASVSGFAGGTMFAPGGMAWVGERGPELVNLPRGSRVYDDRTSQQLLSSMVNNITINAPGGNPAAVARAAEDGVLRAARAMGVR